MRWRRHIEGGRRRGRWPADRPVTPDIEDLAEHPDTLASGQAMEFRVWTELIQQSRGMLHVFLPLLDRGLDAVIHRLTDGSYIPVQVKGRSASLKHSFEITVPASKLVDDRALLIAGQLADEGLGPELLVIDEGAFKRLAAHDLVGGDEIYWAIFGRDPASSRWREYMVPMEKLAERLLGAPPSPVGAAAPESAEPLDRHNQWLGFLGESEVVRRLAENPRLDLFRPFPDLEIVEVLARDRQTGRFVGLQVKTAIPPRHGEAHFRVRKATFVPSPTTWIVALAWLDEEGLFGSDCLLAPSQDLPAIAVEGDDRWVLEFNPAHPNPTRFDAYRRNLADLGRLVARIASDGDPSELIDRA
jgi:hypothetical protein